jgi:phosphatidylglycerol:prolipoprotein diacylglycerol transferase
MGFLVSYFLIKEQEKSRPMGLSPRLVQGLNFYLAVGLVAGARLGYILFYQYMNLSDLFRDPMEIIAVWHGGMSFHGRLIGTVIAGWWFCRRKSLPFWAVGDRVIVTAPIGLGLGRIANLVKLWESPGISGGLPWINYSRWSG